jgi:hypothetical protein
MTATLAIVAFIALGGSIGGFLFIRKIKEALNEESRRKSAENQLEAKQNETKIHAAPRRNKHDIVSLLQDRADD